MRIMYGTLSACLGMCIALMGTAWAQQGNIAVLDVTRVVKESEANKRAETELKKRETDARAKIEKLQGPLETKMRELEQRRSILSEEQFLAEQGELRREIRQFKVEEQSLVEDIQREALRRRKEIADAINTVVNQLARTNGYSMVLPSNVILYSADSVDISEEVLRLVNQQLQ